MADIIPNQDGVEAYRRLMLDAYPERKAGIDKLLGQTAARGTRQGFGKAVVTEGPYAYPTVDGTFAQLVDHTERQEDVIRHLEREVVKIREEFRLAPFA